MYPDEPPPDKGWGPGLSLYRTEIDALKDPARNRMWLVRNEKTGHGAWVLPGHVNGRDDGESDSFSNRDVSVRLYHPNEEAPWGTDHTNGSIELGFNEGEGVAAKDVVFWYVAHFEHQEPLPSLDRNAPCGDPEFPAVLQLHGGENCNDVFGAGPSFLFVQDKSDMQPEPFDYGLSVKTVRDSCGVAGAVPGGVAQFSAAVVGVPAGDKPTYAWSVSGSGALPRAPARVNDSDFYVQLGKDFGPVDVTVSVSLLGLAKSAATQFVPDTPASIQMKQIRCLVVGQERFSHSTRPLWDPERDLVAQPYSRGELGQIGAMGEQLVAISKRLIGIRQVQLPIR